MRSPELDNLVALDALQRQTWPPGKLQTLRERGRARLQDAANKTNSIDGRFDLAYNGAHALALAALGDAGYSSENRTLVFQALKHTTSLDEPSITLLTRAHTLRNVVEYQGAGAITEKFVVELVIAATALAKLLPNP
ncbi:MAG: hypothetical protein ABIZ71_01365 [Gemmatimonadales bacterium]